MAPGPHFLCICTPKSRCDLASFGKTLFNYYRIKHCIQPAYLAADEAVQYPDTVRETRPAHADNGRVKAVTHGAWRMKTEHILY